MRSARDPNRLGYGAGIHCGRTYGPSPLLIALSDIKIAHSVFALPFAVLAAFMAWPAADSDPGRFAAQLALIVLCMVLARTWAMLVNRLADWRFDKDNPRTTRRAIASGRLSPRQGWLIALACAATFIASCAVFLFFRNPWPMILSIPVLAWIALYSYTKRFTFLCHLFLGGALAASPIAAAIAIDPAVFSLPALSTSPSGTGVPPVSTSSTSSTTSSTPILLLAAFVLLWVAGFDIAYALADIDFDRRTGLRSIPARLGMRGALWASRALHAGAFLLLLLAWRVEPRFGAIMLAAALSVAALLIYEHLVLAIRGIAGLPLAFFTINGIVSCLLGAAGIADVLM